MIQERIALEAARLLAHSDLAVTSIAAKLVLAIRRTSRPSSPRDRNGTNRIPDAATAVSDRCRTPWARPPGLKTKRREANLARTEKPWAIENKSENRLLPAGMERFEPAPPWPSGLRTRRFR